MKGQARLPDTLEELRGWSGKARAVVAARALVAVAQLRAERSTRVSFRQRQEQAREMDRRCVKICGANCRAEED
jgi:hypothetical protein